MHQPREVAARLSLPDSAATRYQALPGNALSLRLRPSL